MNEVGQHVEIIGGGLAGLSLGLALRRAHVPVTVFEAGSYPRHRVCGEFITGLHPETIDRLGLEPLLAGAVPHREVAWFQGGDLVCRQTLPETAWAVSRHELDARLAGAFIAAGGTLVTNTRVDPAERRQGRVNATGRRRTGEPWLGLKAHVAGLELASGLELHLGDEAYVGLCRLSDGVVNVCGLFKRRAVEVAGGGDALPAYLRATGLDALADRIAGAQVCEHSSAAVAGLGFGRAGRSASLRLGDAYGMLPPFLGNGMAAAFQMAEEALQPISAWSRKGGDWWQTCAIIGHRIERRFRRRQLWGNAIHPFLLSPGRQRWFAWLARGPSLPLDLLYRAMH